MYGKLADNYVKVVFCNPEIDIIDMNRFMARNMKKNVRLY